MDDNVFVRDIKAYRLVYDDDANSLNLLDKEGVAILDKAVPLQKPIDEVTTQNKRYKHFIKKITACKAPFPVVNNMDEALMDIQMQYTDYQISIETMGKEADKEELKAEEALITEETHLFEEYLAEQKVNVVTWLKNVGNWMVAGEGTLVAGTTIGCLATILGFNALRVEILGDAGSGKSEIEKTVKHLLPKEYMKKGRITEAALFRPTQGLGERYLDRCVIFFGDLGDSINRAGALPALETLKDLSGEGGEAVYTKSDMNDDFSTIELILRGQVGAFYTSPTIVGDNQLQSRVVSYTVSDNRKAFDKFTRYTDVDGVFKGIQNHYREVRFPQFQNYIRFLAKRSKIPKDHIINPYHDTLKEWVFSFGEEYKRNYATIRDSVLLIALLNRNDRGKFTVGEEEQFMFATMEDNLLVTQMIPPKGTIKKDLIDFYDYLISQEGRETQKGKFRLLRPMRCKRSAEGLDERKTPELITARKIKSWFQKVKDEDKPAFGLEASNLNRLMDKLVEMDYIVQIPAGGRSTKKFYSLNPSKGKGSLSNPDLDLESPEAQEKAQDYLINVVLKGLKHKVDEDTFLAGFKEAHGGQTEIDPRELPPWEDGYMTEDEFEEQRSTRKTDKSKRKKRVRR